MLKEYIWGCELNAENKEYVWDSESDEMENEITCTLLLKQAMLATSVPDAEVNVVALESFGISDAISQPLFRLTAGKLDQCQLDILIAHPGSRLSLVQGSGPVYLWGQQLFEFAHEDEEKDESHNAEEVEEEAEEEDDDEDGEEDEATLKEELDFLKKDIAKLDAAEKEMETPVVGKSKKRPASGDNEKSRKRVA